MSSSAMYHPLAPDGSCDQPPTHALMVLERQGILRARMNAKKPSKPTFLERSGHFPERQRVEKDVAILGHSK